MDTEENLGVTWADTKPYIIIIPIQSCKAFFLLHRRHHTINKGYTCNTKDIFSMNLRGREDNMKSHLTISRILSN